MYTEENSTIKCVIEMTSIYIVAVVYITSTYTLVDQLNLTYRSDYWFGSSPSEQRIIGTRKAEQQQNEHTLAIDKLGYTPW